MNEFSDQELLRAYAATQSEEAFATLVRRHIDSVYSTARRLVVDPHLAEDVTQSVFVAVARQALQLQQCHLFSAWLHRTTRNQAATLVRGEVRRRRREMRTAPMNQPDPEGNAIWTEIAPVLDECVAELRLEERDALLLRFFERQSAREIGMRLGISEEAAQKRVARALERLRGVFAGRGINATVTTLAGALTTGVIQSAPPALAATIVAEALTVAVAGSALTPLLTFMASSKIKFAAAAIVAAGLGGTAIYQQNQNRQLRQQLAEIRSQELPAQTVEPVRDEADAEARRAERAELLRLRGEVTVLRQQLAERRPAQPSGHAASDQAQPEAGNPGFIPAENWRNVGFETPARGFESFLAVVRSGDMKDISEVAHWEVTWKENPTQEDIDLVEKSRQDYLEMLQRAGTKISGVDLAPPTEEGERTRVFFRTLTATGEKVDSSFEMVNTGGVWKPLLSMGWRKVGNSYQFATSPVFGPKIDLEP